MPEAPVLFAGPLACVPARYLFVQEVGCKPSGGLLLVAVETAGVSGLKEPASWPHLVQLFIF